MKSAIKANFSMLLITCSLLFFACNNPEGYEKGGMGNFTIIFSEGQGTENSRASVYPPSDSPQGNPDPNAPALSGLNIKVFFIKDDGTTAKTFNFRGNQEIKGSIGVGRYAAVGVEVSLLDGTPYAQGTGGSVSIQSGSNDPIKVLLYYVEPVVMINILTPPTGPCYQGCFLDLTGMVVELSYADGTTSLESNPQKFYAYAPGANSSGPSRIVEQGITPQTIDVFYQGSWASGTTSVNVVDLVSVNATTKGGSRDILEGFPFPFLESIILEGVYSDSTLRVIPVQNEREENWFETNEYYRLTDGVTTRTLIDPVSMKVSYRVASNDADLPTFAQSIGDSPRTTTGTEIFAEISFDNFIQIAGIEAVNPPTKTYTASSNPWLINWMDELEDLYLVLDHFSGLGRWVSFKYAAERKMASVYNFDNFDLALSNEPSYIFLKYELFSGLPGIVQVPLNVVP